MVVHGKCEVYTEYTEMWVCVGATPNANLLKHHTGSACISGHTAQAQPAIRAMVMLDKYRVLYMLVCDTNEVHLPKAAAGL